VKDETPKKDSSKQDKPLEGKGLPLRGKPIQGKGSPSRGNAFPNEICCSSQKNDSETPDKDTRNHPGNKTGDSRNRSDPKLRSHGNTKPCDPSIGVHRNEFKKMAHSSDVDGILTKSTRKENYFEKDKELNMAYLVDNDFIVYLREYDSLIRGLDISEQKLFDMGMIILTEQNKYRQKDPNRINPSIAFPLREYMENCAIPLTISSIKETRDKVNADLEVLYNLSMEFKKPNAKRPFAACRIISARGVVKNSIIKMNFDIDFAKYLLNSCITMYPMRLLQVDERDGYAYYIGRQLLLHYSMDSNWKAGTHNILSMKALMAKMPNLPSEAEFNTEKDRRYIQRIQEPMVNGLKKLAEMGILTWRYCKAKKDDYTKEEWARFDFDMFKDSYITFEIIDFPERKIKSE